jgi:hypothetical protein
VGNFRDSPGGFDFNGFPGYRVDLFAIDPLALDPIMDITVLSSDNNTLTIAEGAFETSTVMFTTGASHPNAGESLGIRLVNLNEPATLANPNGDGIEVNFDNVQLEAVLIPEPSTITLMMLVAGASFIVLRKRK